MSELLFLLRFLGTDTRPPLPMAAAVWGIVRTVVPDPLLALVQIGLPAVAWSVWGASLVVRRYALPPAARPAHAATPSRSLSRAKRVQLRAELRPYLPSIAMLLVVSLSSVPLALISPLPIKIIIDNVVGTRPLTGGLLLFAPAGAATSSDYALTLAISILLSAAILSYAQNLANVWLTSKVANRMIVDMRFRLFRQMQRLSILYHDTKGTGDSTYRIQYDAQWLSSLTTDGIIPVVTDLLTVVGYLVVTLLLDWQLALIALAVTPVMFLLTVVYRRRMKQGWKRVKKTESAAMSAAQETLSAARVVKAFGQEKRENEEFLSRYEETALATIRVTVQGGLYGLGLGITTAFGAAAVFLVGVQDVRAGLLSLGSLILVNIYLAGMFSPLKDMGKSVLNVQNAMAGMDRFHEVLTEKPDVPERPHARRLARATGRIEFRDVTYRYPGEPSVLRGVTFDLPAGRCLGVVGPTGSGKTTLSSLLLRFFDPTGGSIRLDGEDLRAYRIADLRNQFAVVLQDTILFSTTIAENIRFARPGARMREVIAAAKAADAHEFILRLPEGYETRVGERGMRLSGGERQRISIARAFLKDAPILILDEPTSALDVGTEQEILSSLRQLMRGRTTLMIAHRASTLRDCDAILVLDHGRPPRMTQEVAAVLEGMASVAGRPTTRGVPSGGG